MQDMQAYLRKLHLDAVDCALISKLATDPQKKELSFGTDPWQWRCGFYPGSEPGDCTSGTAATFDQARADFEEAWRVFLANRTEADFDEYRKHRAWTAWKYAMWDSGCKLPTQLASGRSRCFCGAVIDIKGMSQHVHVAHMEAA